MYSVRMNEFEYIVSYIEKGELPKINFPTYNSDYTVGYGGAITTFSSKRAARKFREQYNLGR